MNLKKIEKWVTTWWGMWLVFFIYTAVLAAFVQLIVLPHFLPGMHYGHGLFVPDSTGFDQLARSQAAAMMKDGWKAWQLHPKNQYPAGMASVFYYLWDPEPFALIPFNAALHATAGCLVFFLLFSFIPNRMAAFGGAALFVLNPASLEWTSQIHRDGTFILGNLLIISAWLLVLQFRSTVSHRERRCATPARRATEGVPVGTTKECNEAGADAAAIECNRIYELKCSVLKNIKTAKWQFLVYSAFTFLIGALMIWASRSYWLQVVLPACAVMTAVIFFPIIGAWHKSHSIKIHHIAPVLLGCIMLITLITFIRFSIKVPSFTEAFEIRQADDLITEQTPDGIVFRMGFKARMALKDPASGKVMIIDFGKSSVLPQNFIPGIVFMEGPLKNLFLPDRIIWRVSPFMPNYVDSKLNGLSKARLGAARSGGKSLIDPEVQFMSAKEYLFYLPRALQVGFLIPFPSMCFTHGSTAGTTMGRTVLGIFTMFFYVCLAFFVWNFRIYWKSHNFRVIVLWSAYGLLIYTYVYPNLGTLNRLRYGFFMTIVSIGFAFAIIKMQHKPQRHRDTEKRLNAMITTKEEN